MAAPLLVVRCTAQSTDRTNQRLPDLRTVLVIPRLPHLRCPGNGGSAGGGGGGGFGGSSNSSSNNNLRKSPSGASQYLRAIPITSSVQCGGGWSRRTSAPGDTASPQESKQNNRQHPKLVPCVMSGCWWELPH
uniref:Uncharacterized protein n=1 Tax=Anopheles minimus TaxID=112268 RepID=A0A182VVP3_9DIPT